MTDYTRPSTWRPYKNQMCNNCHADCCRLPVEVRLGELVTMGVAEEYEISEELEQLIKRLKRENIVRLFDRNRQIVTLSQTIDESCVFLNKERRCSIYDKRPETCRKFPQIGPRPSFCPWNSL